MGFIIISKSWNAQKKSFELQKHSRHEIYAILA